LAKHWQTGAALPTATFERIRAARIYRAGSMTLRQVYFSQVDIELHHRYAPGGAITALDVQRAVARTHTVLPPLPEDRSLCSFSHIFAGGYAAGYYSYKWAEVLAADAFAAFTEAGLADGPAIATTGRRFRDTVLSLGGGTHPLEVFKRFRGREPSTAALIAQTGLR
jgi:oligopeptidase A